MDRNPRMILSTLWIFVTFNYVYADVFGLLDPQQLKTIMSGTVGSVTITQEFLLIGAILMEIPIAMILLARVLPYTPNRIANWVTAVVKTIAVIASLTVAKPTMYYAFFCSIEIACTCYIFWFVWRWKREAETQLA